MSWEISGLPIEMQDCIRNCNQCNATCQLTIIHSLDRGQPYAETDRIRLLVDCSEMCKTAENFMLRDSALHTVVCRACAQVCGQCAERCERMVDDPQFIECAKACRRCADSCERIASVVA
jgi:hypothetical protein